MSKIVSRAVFVMDSCMIQPFETVKENLKKYDRQISQITDFMKTIKN